uniref:Major capsid protein n=1 Tax=Dulem virus 213 TaxID=3145690 RepID=A0AAU8B146_9VIRU
MSLTRSIGKNTLGGGKKMNVDLRTYNRSTHDLSYIWRSSMAAGTLVPFCKILTTPGDTMEIDLTHQIMTHPTIGPLFGSYKVQADVFQCPIRLYNAMLHNNALNIGLKMSDVKLPKIEVQINDVDTNTVPGISGNTQISESCILAYLGQRGYAGYVDKPISNPMTIKRNAVPLLAYYDIFKNYYANKQEDYFYTIAENTPLNFNDVLYSNTKEAYGQKTQINKNGYIGINKNSKYFTSNTTVDDGLILSVSKTVNEVKRYINYRLIDIIDTESETPSAQTWNVPNYGNIDVQVFKIKNIGTEEVSALIEKTIDTKTKSLHKYKLNQIDEVREDLLGAGKNEWTTKQGWPYIKELFERTWGITVGNYDGSEKDFPFPGAQGWTSLNSSSIQAGLCVKTYQSDIFNNWVNTEWIDGPNGINAVTAIKIDPESQSFQLDTLNLAKKVYDMLNRIAVSGGTYQDWIETIYTNDYVERSETPIYEGGMSAELEFQEVISQSATQDEPLGTLAGRGKTTNQKGGHIIVKVSEPSYLIGIISLTPRVDYCQGNDFDTTLETLDDIHKPALDAIGFQDRMCETLDWKSVRYNADGSKTNGSIGKQPAWIDYMTNFNKTYGNFAIKDNEAFMVLNRWFESNPKTQEGDYTSYIDPQKYNYIFADTDLNAMNFWVQIGVNIKARRMISAKVIPNL